MCQNTRASLNWVRVLQIQWLCLNLLPFLCWICSAYASPMRAMPYDRDLTLVEKEAEVHAVQRKLDCCHFQPKRVCLAGIQKCLSLCQSGRHSASALVHQSNSTLIPLAPLFLSIFPSLSFTLERKQSRENNGVIFNLLSPVQINIALAAEVPNPLRHGFW